MNILNLLNYSPDFGGGIAKHLLALGKIAKLNGHKLYIGFPKKRDWQNELELNSQVIIIPEIENALWSDFPAIIRKICNCNSIDILHIHFTFAQVLSLACSIRRLDIPTIYHWHNPPIALNEFITAQKTLRGKLKRFYSGFVARIADRRVITQHVSISKEITELLIRNKWTEFDKITFLSNGISISDHGKIFPKVLNKGLPVIGTVANFRPQKDHETLLKAFSILCKVGMKSELWIIGDGPTRESMENLAVELNIMDQVRFLGTISDPSELYQQFDIFVLSTHYEGHPLVLLEAMSFGIPIVATKVSSIPEVITHGINGLLVNPRDPSGLALTLQSLLQDELMYSKLREDTLNFFKQQKSVDEWAQCVSTLYENILFKKKSY